MKGLVHKQKTLYFKFITYRTHKFISISTDWAYFSNFCHNLYFQTLIVCCSSKNFTNSSFIKLTLFWEIHHFLRRQMKTEAHAMKKTRTSLIQCSITLKKKKSCKMKICQNTYDQSFCLSLVIWYSIKVGRATFCINS